MLENVREENNVEEADLVDWQILEVTDVDLQPMRSGNLGMRLSVYADAQGQSNSWSQGKKALKYPVHLIHGDVDIPSGPALRSDR